MKSLSKLVLLVGCFLLLSWSRIAETVHAAVSHDADKKTVAIADPQKNLVLRLNYNGRCLLDQVLVRGREVVPSATGVCSGIEVAGQWYTTRNIPTPKVTVKEDTVTVNDGHASRSVLANHLLALVKLDTLILEACNDMLCSGVIAKNAHVCGACGTAFLGINGEVHRIAARIHGMDMLVAIDDVVAKSERVNVKCHGLCPF